MMKRQSSVDATMGSSNKICLEEDPSASEEAAGMVVPVAAGSEVTEQPAFAVSPAADCVDSSTDYHAAVASGTRRIGYAAVGRTGTTHEASEAGPAVDFRLETTPAPIQASTLDAAALGSRHRIESQPPPTSPQPQSQSSPQPQCQMSETLMLYNWQRCTMSQVTNESVLMTHEHIEQPLAHALCCAFAIVIRDNEVFASLPLGSTYRIQVFDLNSGQLLKDIPSEHLSAMRRILLTTHSSRIYASNLEGRTVCEINSQYRLSKVIQVKNPIGKVWVERHTETAFVCTYSHAATKRLVKCSRYHGQQFENKFTDEFLRYSMFGFYAGTYYLLSDDVDKMTVVYGRESACDFALAQKVVYPYSYRHCKEFVYVLSENGILAINTRTRLCSTINAGQVAGKVDEECRLIPRLVTLPH